jgi:hypothetical protein
LSNKGKNGEKVTGRQPNISQIGTSGNAGDVTIHPAGKRILQFAMPGATRMR